MALKLDAALGDPGRSNSAIVTEQAVGAKESVARHGNSPPPDIVQEEVQKRIELRVSQSFFEAVKLLAESEGIARADVIRKAISLYARARMEQKQGNFIAFARMAGDNSVEIVDMLTVI
jgi:hypothetical protein